MSEADAAALQVNGSAAAVAMSPGAGGFSLASVLAWAAVGIPILWGVWITLTEVAVLFR